MSYLLLDVKNRDMNWNGKFSASQSSEKSRFTDTVLTNKTVSAAICQSQRGIRQDSETTNCNIDTLDLDVLALLLSHSVRAQLERVDLHEEVLVRLRLVWLVQELRCLILDGLELLLVLLGSNLPLSLLKLLAIDLRLDLSGVRRLQINSSTRETKGRGHVALRIDGNGVVQSLCWSRWSAQIDIRRAGCAKLLNPFLHKLLELRLVLLGWISRCGYQQRSDGCLGVGDRSGWLVWVEGVGSVREVSDRVLREDGINVGDLPSNFSLHLVESFILFEDRLRCLRL